MKNLFLASLLLSYCAFAHEYHIVQKAPLKIVTIGYPVLRAQARAVDPATISEERFQDFIDDMFETMKKAGGVGLAAPQVGVSKRIFVMGGGGVPKTTVINPVVQYLDHYGQKNSREGCLSIPGKRVRIKRHKRIHMDYLNRDGESVSRELSGFEAIVAQHEYDHLKGVLMIDYVSKEIDLDDYADFPQM